MSCLQCLTPCVKASAESSPQKPGSKELDAKIQSYFCENDITFNTASPSFALMIQESMKFTRQNPLQSYKVPHWLKFSGELLDNAYEFTEKLVAPIFVVATKYGALIACSRCLLGIMKMCSLCWLCCVALALCPAWPSPVRLTPADPRNYHSQGAHFDWTENYEAL